MTNTEIKNRLSVKTISKRNGIYTARKRFFYRNGFDESKLVERVKNIFPEAEIIDYGEHYTAFKGGASVANQSHWYVKFKIN